MSGNQTKALLLYQPIDSLNCWTIDSGFLQSLQIIGQCDTGCPGREVGMARWLEGWQGNLCSWFQVRTQSRMWQLATQPLLLLNQLSAKIILPDSVREQSKGFVCANWYCQSESETKTDRIVVHWQVSANTDRRHVISNSPIRPHHSILPLTPTLSHNVIVNDRHLLINLHFSSSKYSELKHTCQVWMSCSLGMAIGALGRCRTKTMRTAMPL